MTPASSRATNSQSISSSARMASVEDASTCGDGEVAARGVDDDARDARARRTRRECAMGGVWVLFTWVSGVTMNENQKKLSAARFLPPPWESRDFVDFGGAEYVFP